MALETVVLLLIRSRLVKRRLVIARKNWNIWRQRLRKRPHFLSRLVHRAGHSLSDMQLQIIEKVFDKSEAVRLTRERQYINLFEAENLGMNKKN